MEFNCSLKASKLKQMVQCMQFDVNRPHDSNSFSLPLDVGESLGLLGFQVPKWRAFEHPMIRTIRKITDLFILLNYQSIHRQQFKVEIYLILQIGLNQYRETCFMSLSIFLRENIIKAFLDKLIKNFKNQQVFNLSTSFSYFFLKFNKNKTEIVAYKIRVSDWTKPLIIILPTFHFITSIIITIKLQMNPEQCRNHVLNSSGAKYAYKFGNSTRFKAPRLHTHSMYTLEDKQVKKACGFGFGQRPGLGNQNQFPSPQKYNIPSTITKKSKTFGSSRENTQFRSFLLKAMKQACYPAPNRYVMPSSIHERKFSLGARLPTEIDLKTKNHVPPPDAYDLDGAGCPANGKYVSSRYKNARKIIFFGREQPEPKGFPIGPGSYNIANQSLDENNFRSTTKSFGTASRPGPEDKSKKFVPGPGMYQTFSEFPSQFEI